MSTARQPGVPGAEGGLTVRMLGVRGVFIYFIPFHGYKANRGPADGRLPGMANAGIITGIRGRSWMRQI